jgi:hypothetical protein
MSYVITLTNRIDVGTDTAFKCILSDTISIKRNSFLKVQSAYLEKPNLAATASGIYVCIKEFATSESYWCNQDRNAKQGLVACINDFPAHVGATADDILNLVSNMPKIPLNNQEMTINELNVELRDRTGAIINPSLIDVVSITLSISVDPNILS